MPPGNPPQVTLAFYEAAAVILARAHRLLTSSPGVLIGVTGPVGAGKSTLARALAEPPAIVRTDDFLPDYARVPYHERDDPAHADLPALAAVLSALRAGAAAHVPIWSHHTHRREGSRLIQPASIIAVEGIHALHEAIAPQLHIRVYIDAPAQERWQRWEAIERAGQRGMGVEAARRFFNDVAEPAFARHGAPARATAHYIVINDT